MSELLQDSPPDADVSRYDSNATLEPMTQVAPAGTTVTALGEGAPLAIWL